MSVPESLLPPDEEDRIRALHDLRILDTPREERFDALISELATTLDAPIAYFALIAEDRQWIKSKVGPLPTHARREDAFCSRTILQGRPLVVSDASQDARFSNSPLVQADPNLRFYAGVPISDSSGHTVGTVCVAGPTPREISDRDLAILEGFAARLQTELNTRPRALLAFASEDEEWVSRLLASHPRLGDPESFDLWSSRRMDPDAGTVWQLKDALWHAGSVVLLVSPAFLRSRFVGDPSFRMLLAAWELQEVTTRMVLLEPCDRAAAAWLADRSPWPPSGQAISLGTPAEVGRHLRELAVELAGEVPPQADEGAGAADAPAAGPRVFLSHASEDAAAVRDLAERLRRGGVNVWLDLDELQPGDDWMQELEQALDGSDAFAVYIGRTGIARWIGREVRVALDRNAKDPRFRFIPILGPGADPESLPRFVAQHHWLDLRDGDPEPAKIRKLVGSILARPPETVSLLPPGEPPFRGLLTFGVEHAHLFFGRDQETRELLQRLEVSPFLAVVGDSGSGKSSLVRAGVIPALHRGHFGGAAAQGQSWQVAILKPGSDPFRELGSALLELLPETSPAEKMATLDACAGQLSEGTRGLSNAISALVSKGDCTLLVIDQFEEVFTQSADPDERDRFIDTLLEASNRDGERPIYVVVTLRADFYSHCFEHPRLPGVLWTSQYAVRAIGRDELAEVIEKPAILAGVKLEAGLVEAILFDLGEGPGNLPLLEHTLLQLWKLRAGQTLTHAAYEEVGRVQGALEHHAEDVYGSFQEEEKRIARKLLLGLVVPTKNAGPARRRTLVSEVLPSGDSRPAAERVLERMVDERLLMVRRSGVRDADDAAADETREDDREVEVTHEALLRGWRRLGGWLEEDREFLFWHQRTRASFEGWRDSGRDPGALLRGAPLAEARRWLDERGEDLSSDGRSFIRRSIALARRQKRIWQAVTVAIALTGAAALAFAVMATRARRQAEENLLLATTAIDEMLTQVGSEALEDVPQLEEVRRELLTRAKALYEQLGGQSSSSPELELQTALAPARIAEINRQMGDHEASLAGLESAIADLERLAAERPRRADYRLELARIHNEAGRVARFAGRAEAAAGHLDRAVELDEALVESDPDIAEYAYEHGRCHLNRGIVRAEAGKIEEAEADYLEAVAAVGAFTSQESEWRIRILQHLARSRNQLGNLYRRDRSEEAAEQYRLASRILEGLVHENPESRELRIELAKIFSNLALHQRSNGEPEEAVDYSGRAVAMFGDLADALPEIRSEWAYAHTHQGLALMEVGQQAAAVDSLSRATQIFADLLSDYPQRPTDLYREAVTLLYLASLRADAGEASEVERIRLRLQEILPRLEPEVRARIERHPRYARIREGP